MTLRYEVSVILGISLFICVAFFIVYIIKETGSMLALYHKTDRILDSMLGTLEDINSYIDNEYREEDYQGSFSTLTNKKE